jgi:hypothetical protein
VLNVLEDIFSCFISIVFVRLIESACSSDRYGRLDVTERVKGRLSSTIATMLAQSKVPCVSTIGEPG